MALRVLLADESSTIKKVIQLALQDFGVEVKSVHSGVDVLAVAKTFKPDLFFVDVLLQKRNGYEVAQDIKLDADLNEIPVVLMWSSFMDLDEAAATRARPNARLEKPFDSEALRSLVLDLVPRARTQTLSNYLEFPPISEPAAKAPAAPVQMAPPITDKIQTPPTAMALPAEPVAPPATEVEASNFKFANLPPPIESARNPMPSALPPQKEAMSEEENWSHQDLGRFKLNLEPMKLPNEDSEIKFDVDHGQMEGEKNPIQSAGTTTNFQFLSSPLDRSVVQEIELPSNYREVADEPNILSSFEVTDAEKFDVPHRAPSPFSSATSRASTDLIDPTNINAESLERIVRAQSQEMIETLVRRLVPELAERLIREELARLLAEGPP
jgi:CheY-like chemotaxis protein